MSTIILVRHASAVDEALAGSDRDRWLDDNGRQTARVLARLLREHAVEPTIIASSPLPRAVQTAELIANGLDYLAPIETWRSLEPSAQPEVASRQLGAHRGVVVLVSHEPIISALTALLVGQPAFATYRTAQACMLVDRKPTFKFRGDIGATSALFID